MNRLTFEDFRRLANDSDLSSYEKIGFPDEYRAKHEKYIYADIINKLKEFWGKNKTILDIGCGCSDLPFMLIEKCEKQNNDLILVDSEEMLAHLPDKPFMKKIACRFPDCAELLDDYKDSVDIIITYSVMQHVILESNPFNFIDRALDLLKTGGKMLLGDIPNISKRKRFFSSRNGIECHRKFTGTDETPRVDFMKIEHERIDDAIIFAILQRYRNSGYETYLLPQGRNLPMANRREDILIVKP
jgi:SAM-dependent methyltransferase